MKGTCLLLATQLEAAVILNDPRLEWKLIDEVANFYQDECSGLFLCVTGIGPVRSAYAMGLLAQRHDIKAYLNLGVAGALKSFEVGDICKAGLSLSAFEKHPFDRSLDRLRLSEEPLTCLSVGEALHDQRLKLKYAKRSDIVDMELYSLAFSAAMAHKNLVAYKVISDFAQAQDAKLIVQRIPELMAKCWAFVLEQGYICLDRA
jgi:nucleoside phosphorylase